MPQSEEVATRRANEDIITEGRGGRGGGVFWLWRRCADEKAAAVKAEEAGGEKGRSFGRQADASAKAEMGIQRRSVDKSGYQDDECLMKC